MGFVKKFNASLREMRLAIKLKVELGRHILC